MHCIRLFLAESMHGGACRILGRWIDCIEEGRQQSLYALVPCSPAGKDFGTFPPTSRLILTIMRSCIWGMQAL
ncbi:MAG: hypothetical protein D6703_01410 [Zetaproteobacteria bacterium]|nr:MAG: hypothetical protein D6703_01410 [Zetaproteobacteria bacterium]